MQRFITALGTGPDWRAVVRDCLDQLHPLPREANLGFLYATDPLAPHLERVVALLRRQTGVNRWVGSQGIGVCTTGREVYETPALAVMVTAFPENDFHILPTLASDNDPFPLADWTQGQRHHFGILHGDPRNGIIPHLLRTLARLLPGGEFAGGLTSCQQGGYVQVADTLTEGGLSGVLFSPRVPVTLGLTQGCTPVGPVRHISHCELNVIHRIDGRPALEVLYEDVGEILARDPKRIAGYIFLGLPTGRQDDYLVRNLLGLDLGQGRLFVGERVSPGQPLLFARRDGNSARDDLLRMMRDLRRRLPGPPRGGLYFSCIGRGRHLFGDDSQELRLIRDELGNVPLAGFFANGEICRDRLYGYTGVLALFS